MCLNCGGICENCIKGYAGAEAVRNTVPVPVLFYSLLGYELKLGLEEFSGSGVAEDLPGIVVNPILYCFDICSGIIGDVTTFGYLASYFSIHSFVGSTLPRGIRVAVVYVCSLTIEDRFFHTFDIGKLCTIIDSYGLKDTLNSLKGSNHKAASLNKTMN